MIDEPIPTFPLPMAVPDNRFAIGVGGRPARRSGLKTERFPGKADEERT